MDIRPLHEGFIENLLNFERENREYFATMNFVRSDSFYQRDNFFAAQRTLIREHFEEKVFHYVMFEDDEIIARLSLVNVVGEPYKKGWMMARIKKGHRDSFLGNGGIRLFLDALTYDGLVHSVETDISEDDDVGTKALVKAGFKEVGFMPKFSYENGVWQDSVLFRAVLSDDF